MIIAQTPYLGFHLHASPLYLDHPTLTPVLSLHSSSTLVLQIGTPDSLPGLVQRLCLFLPGYDNITEPDF